MAVAYLEPARRNRLVEVSLGVPRPPRRILTTRSGVASNSHPIYSSTNPNPLLGGRNFFGGTLGTSTFSGGQQPQHQQLTTGSLLSSRSAEGLGQQQLIGLKGSIMRGTLLLPSVGFRYTYFVGCFFFFRY